jgi:hypothetical protein
MEMRLLNYLQEKYISIVQANTYSRDKISIFENPTKKEMREVGGENEDCRFIINFRSKKLYVFDSGLIHQEALNELYSMNLVPTNKLFGTTFIKSCFAGIGELSSNKIIFIECYEGQYLSVFKNSPWTRESDKWLNPWFITSFLEATELGNEEVKIEHGFKRTQ